MIHRVTFVKMSISSGFKSRHIIIFLVLVFTLFSCERDNIPVDPYYPTTINKLDYIALSHIRDIYNLRNKYLHSSLNEFGFCDMGDVPSESPPLLESLTEAEAIETVKNFVQINPSETGVENIDELRFDRTSFRSGYYDGSTTWIITSSCQNVDTIEIVNTNISFRIKNREVVFCTGNWFSDIYIPERFIFSQTHAKASLLNRVVEHYNFAGEGYYVRITSNDLASSKTKLSIVPLTKDESIELRVAWRIEIASVAYIIFVDVMTGEVIYKESTIIS
jgi:hypothetical protein